MDAVELARRCEQDGASTGVNLEETLKIAGAVKIPIIASGRVATLDDVRNLLPLEKEGVEGVIVGPMLYAGGFTFQLALSVSVT